MSHPLLDSRTPDEICATDGPKLDTEACNTLPCGGVGLASGDGVGPGCFSDSDYMSPNEFKCFDSTEFGFDDAEKEKNIFNELGFVPHNYACFNKVSWGSVSTCDAYSQVVDGIGEEIQKETPALCNCHEGVCNWEVKEGHVDRSDCTRGYEWIRMPIAPDHPHYDKLVDFETGKSVDATHIIVVEISNFPPKFKFQVTRPNLNSKYPAHI